MTTAAAPPSRTWRDVVQGLRWYVREVSGESGYDRYLARHRREHPDQPPLDARTWWQVRSDGRNGQAPQRCC